MSKKLKTQKVSQVEYNKLTEKQKKFFDEYVKHRAMEPTRKALDWWARECYDVYNSVGVQNALKEYNKNLEEYSLYNTAMIVNELWEQYRDSDTPKNVKIQILSLLGKHIGMWNNVVNERTKKGEQNTVNYTIINYADVKKEIEENKEEVEKVSKEDFNVPDGLTITDYSGEA